MKHVWPVPRMVASWFVAAATFTMVAGCTGSVGFGEDTATGGGGSPAGGAGGGVVSPPPSDQPFTCDATTAPAAHGWRKLTTAQYQNTVRDLVSFAVRADAAATTSVMNAVGAALSGLPPDERQKIPQDLHGSYRRLDQEVEQLHIDATYQVALTAAAALTSPPRLSAVVGACATDASTTNDAECLTSFVQRFGERALRRPLTPDEVTFYKGFYGTGEGVDPAGLADVIRGFPDGARVPLSRRARRGGGDRQDRGLQADGLRAGEPTLVSVLGLDARRGAVERRQVGRPADP